MVSVSCWFSVRSVSFICLWCRESCYGQCAMLVLCVSVFICLWCRESCYGQMLVLCTVSVFHLFVMQRALLWSMCHVGSLYGQCLSSVCGAESPVMVSVPCWFSVRSVSFICLWCRESCYGQCAMLVLCVGSLYGQCLSSVCGAESPVMVSVSCWFSVRSVSFICLWCRESCYGQCVVLVLCTVSVFHLFVVQRVLLWSVCHVGSLYGQCLSSVCGAESPVMVSVPCWFSVRSVSFICLWCRESCYGQCVMLVLCTVSVFHLFVVQRVLLWSVCHVGSLYGQCLSSVCGAESPVMVNVSCGGHAMHHVGSHVSVFHLFVVREPCRGHCHFGCGKFVMS